MGDSAPGSPRHGSIARAASNPRLRISNGVAVWMDDGEVTPVDVQRPSDAPSIQSAIIVNTSEMRRASSRFLGSETGRESIKKRRRPSEMLKGLLQAAGRPLRRGSNLNDLAEDAEGGLRADEVNGAASGKMRESLAARLSLAPSFTSEEMRVAATEMDPEKLRALMDASPFIAWCKSIIESPIVSIVMTVATIWVLFAADFTQAALPKSADYGMQLVSVIVFFLFVVEFVIMCIANGTAYVGRLFFFLDFLSVISLLPDVVHFFGSDAITNALSNLSVARAGRAARASTRIARMLRVVRIVRLWRKDRVTGSAAKLQEENDEDILRPTKVGTKLQASTTNKWVVGLIVLLLLFNFTEDSSDTSVHALENGLEELSWSLNASSDATAMATMYSVMFVDILYLRVPWAEFPYYGTPYAIEHDFRESEYLKLVSANGLGLAYYSIRSSVKFQAVLSIILTISLIVLLVVGNALFQRDLNTLVIGPISKMTSIITGLATNPLMNVATYGTQAENQYETGLLMTMISKLGYLLQIAFGTAGAKIISENMSTDGDLHPMVPGRKMSAIFGFCDIRTFTDVTEHLKEDVMLFVNQIADVVHSAVCRNSGSPNKNIGDAFLLVWKPAEVDPRADGTRPPSGNQPGRNTQSTSAATTTPKGRTPRGSTAKEPGAGVTVSTDDGNDPVAMIVVSEDVDGSSNDHNGVTLPGQVAGGVGDGLAVSNGGAERSPSSHDIAAVQKHSDNSLAGHEQSVALLAQLSVGTLKSFLEVQEGLVSSDVLCGMVARLQKVMPNYRLKMGFGFHVGWAIEGPIGSNYKVDASYLSPHVNITARLESATKQYGVDNLFSGQFYSVVPSEYRGLFLKIDIVNLKGSRAAVFLYTLNPRFLTATGKDHFTTEILTLKSDAVAETKAHYEAAIGHYIDGRWRQAREMLSKYDTPTDYLRVAARVLLDFMKETDYVPPPNWTGVRALTDK
eukprot:Opistho-1_new@42546